MVVRTIIVPLSILAIRILLLKFLPEANNVADYTEYKVPDEKHFFDFIVVGSGAAGAIVAARLSENLSWDVLLLEAGGIPPPESYIPALHLLLYDNEANWGYKTAPQKHSMFGYEGRSNQFPRGKVLGGCSTINYMMYVRGNKKDYDNWAAMGNLGWDYETVLPYFKMSEDYEPNPYFNNSEFHGYGGPMKVIPKPWGTPLQKTFLKAGRQLGYPTVDPNAQNQVGFSTPDMTIKNGIRQSTAETFLRPNLKRKNLHILTNSLVTKIIFDEQKRAVGVIYLHNEKYRRVALAKREVILSAGAVDSPKLLMLSGVGPKTHLLKHDIPVVHDLPGVGQNFHDHPVIFGLTWTVEDGHSLSIPTYLNPATFHNFFKTRKGPLTTAFGVEGNSWAQLSGGDPDWPDAQFLLMSVTPTYDFGLYFSNIIGYERQLFKRYFANAFGKEGFCIGTTVVRPKSRGSITLKSKNPLEPPNIDPNFFGHPDDLDVMVKAIKFSLKIGSTMAFLYGHGTKFLDTPLPGCDHLILESDEYWACYARFMTSTIYHPAGSCKMAPAWDEMGVVDNRLRVRGVKGLRVIDASIMPIVSNGNTNAPSMMIGERGAALVIEDWTIH